MRWAVCGFQFSVFPLPPSPFSSSPLYQIRWPNFKIAASNLNCNAREPAAADCCRLGSKERPKNEGGRQRAKLPAGVGRPVGHRRFLPDPQRLRGDLRGARQEKGTGIGRVWRRDGLWGKLRRKWFCQARTTATPSCAGYCAPVVRKDNRLGYLLSALP